MTNIGSGALSRARLVHLINRGQQKAELADKEKINGNENRDNSSAG